MGLRGMNENKIIYEKLINGIKYYYKGKDIFQMFLHGGCYWLALTLHKYIPDSAIVFNQKMQHCACLFNQGVYDIRGRIHSGGFVIAGKEDMEYMKKHLVLYFDTKGLGCYLNELMKA